MILDDSEVNLRLASADNLVNKLSQLEIINLRQGKTNGATTIPPMVKELIGGLAAVSDETQDDIAETFGISQPKVSQIINGNGTIGDRPAATAYKTAKEEKKEAAHEAALDSLMASLNTVKAHMTLPGTMIPLREASRLAKDMAGVITALEPKQDNSLQINNTKVVLFAPPQKSEEFYQTIEV
jgi:predicted transcriptional regulator